MNKHELYYDTNSNNRTNIYFISNDNKNNDYMSNLLKYKKILILSEYNIIKNLKEKYLVPLLNYLESYNNSNKLIEVIIKEVPDTDFFKNDDIVNDIIENCLLKNSFTKKDSLILCYGGGKISDLGGYISSIYLRGIDFSYFPTTLLAMSDASIGGKNGINNLKYGKNLIGTINQPLNIYIDLSILNVYEDINVVISDGIAEIVKILCLFDKSKCYLNKLLKNIEVYTCIHNNKNVKKLSKNSFKHLEEVIVYCINLKINLIKLDVKDLGIRNCLNFGHTIGHGIEAVDNFNLTHGQAVSIGLLIEIKILAFLDKCYFDSYYYIKSILEKFNLPTSIPEYILVDNIISKIKNDKKNVNSNSCKIIHFKYIGFMEEFIQLDKQNMSFLLNKNYKLEDTFINVCYNQLEWLINDSICIADINNPIKEIEIANKQINVNFIKGSKSICNRALILSFVQTYLNKVTLHNFNICEDTSAMINCFESLGHSIEYYPESSKLVIEKTITSHVDNISINVENSGTTARFIILYLLFNTKGINITVNSSERMTKRPNKELFDFIINNFTGYSIKFLSKENSFPLLFCVAKEGVQLKNDNKMLSIDGLLSSQFVSSILLNCYKFFECNKLSLFYKKSTSFQYINMSVKMVKKVGYNIIYDEDKSKFTFNKINKISCNYKTCEDFLLDNLFIEPDASTVNFVISHVAINGGNIKIIGLGKNSLQGDSNYLYFLNKLGFCYSQFDKFTIFDNTNNYQLNKINLNNNYKYLELDLSLITDSFIAFSVVSAKIKNLCIKITGIQNQNIKESNRIDLVSYNLNRLGFYSYVDPNENSLIIDNRYIRHNILNNIYLDSGNDHRIAMAFIVLAYNLRLKLSYNIVINKKDCVFKTYPEFYKDFSLYFNYNFKCNNTYKSNSEFNLIECNYLNSPIILIGMKSSGKSYLGNYYSMNKNLKYIDLDEVIYNNIKKNYLNNLDYNNKDEVKLFVENNNYSSNNLYELILLISEKNFREYEYKSFIDVIYNTKCLAKTLISCGGGIINNYKFFTLIKSFDTVIYIDNTLNNCLNNLNNNKYIYKDKFNEVFVNRKSLYEKLSNYTFSIPLDINNQVNKQLYLDNISVLFSKFVDLKLGYNKTKISSFGSFMLCYFIDYDKDELFKLIEYYNINEINIEYITNYMLKLIKIPYFNESTLIDFKENGNYELIEIRFDKLVNDILNKLKYLNCYLYSEKELLINELIKKISFVIKINNINCIFMFTLRSIDDGGYFDKHLHQTCYFSVIENVLKYSYFEFIDIEFDNNEYFRLKLYYLLMHKQNSRIVLSKHNIKVNSNNNLKFNNNFCNISLKEHYLSNEIQCYYFDLLCFYIMINTYNIDIVKIITNINNLNLYNKFKLFVNNLLSGEQNTNNIHIIEFCLGDSYKLTRVLNNLYTPVYDENLSLPTGKGQMTRSEVNTIRSMLNIGNSVISAKLLDYSIPNNKMFYAVLGANVSNSLSPYMHFKLWKQYIEYIKFSCNIKINPYVLSDLMDKSKTNEFNNILQTNNMFKFINIIDDNDLYKTIFNNTLDKQETRAINFSITMPYKEIIYDNVCYSKDTLNAKSCNTIKKIGDLIYGYNTDYVATYYILTSKLTNIITKNNIKCINYIKILLIGAGGAAKGVLFSIQCLNGIKSNNIYIYNRSDCSSICNKFKINSYKECIVCNSNSNSIQNLEFHIVISTIPSNCSTEYFKDFIFKDKNINKNTLFIDLAYNKDTETDFMAFLKTIYNKIDYVSGIEFLELQGIYQFEIFSGFNINI